jgi:ABC-type Fe3+ transport system substrate-binding protein
MVLLACGSPAAGGTPPAGGTSAAAAKADNRSAHSPEVLRLLAAAEAAGETELGLVWGEGAFGGTDGVRQYEALFNRLYGLNVRFHYTPGPTMPDMAARTHQEVAAGQKASTDVLNLTESNLAPLLGRDVLEAYDYGALSPRIAADFLAPGQAAVEAGGLIPGITYNSELIAEADAPRRLEDVLNPRWKGKIASTVSASYFEYVAQRPEWGPERMKGFVGRLSEQVAGLIRIGDTSRIISGEFQMLVLQSGRHQIQRLQDQGAPLQFVVPTDAAVTGFWYLGVPRTAAHPNLAKLFINMIMSEEGQAVLYAAQGADHAALPGSRSAAQLEALKAQRGELLRIDAKYFLEHPQMTELSDELLRILRQGHGS